MKAEKAINKQARQLLAKGNLACSVGVTIVLLVALMTCIYLSYMLTDAVDLFLSSASITLLSDNPLLYATLFVIINVVFIILSLPLFLGAVRYSYNLAKNEESNFADLFYYLHGKRYFSSAFAVLRYLLRQFWKMIISFLPGVLILLTAAATAAEKENLDFYNILWYSISYAMIIGGIFLFSFLTSGSFLTLYLIVENENFPVDDALNYSEYAMRGCEKSVHRILFLYLPFLVLCLAVIPVLFVLPYIMTSYGISAKWIIQLQKRQNEVE